MNANLERKLPHLRQFFNIVFGLSFAILILSLPAPETFQWQVILTSILLFLFLGLLVVHAWWRQADMMSTTRLMKWDTWLILFLRLFFLYTLVYWVRTLVAADVSHFWGWTAIFVNATLLYALSTVQQLIVMHPLYGKNRVMQRREVITDSLLTLISALYVVGLFFYSDFFMAWPGELSALALVIGVRPVAKALTVWKELPPPHRGGRRVPESSSDRSKRQQQRGSSSRNQRQSSTSTSGSSSSRKVVSARSLREEKGSQQRGSRQSSRRERRSQQSRPAEKTAEAERQPSAEKSIDRSATREESAEPAQEVRPETRIDSAESLTHQSDKQETSQAEEARVDMSGTGMPAATDAAQPVTPAAESSSQEEAPKPIYGRRPAKKAPDLSDLDSSIEEEIDSIDSVMSEAIGTAVSSEGKAVTYGRKPRRKQPELLEDLAGSETQDAAETTGDVTEPAENHTEPEKDRAGETHAEAESNESSEDDKSKS